MKRTDETKPIQQTSCSVSSFLSGDNFRQAGKDTVIVALCVQKGPSVRGQDIAKQDENLICRLPLSVFGSGSEAAIELARGLAQAGRKPNDHLELQAEGLK